MKTYRIAAIPGDGIGQEVVPAGCQVLQALAASTGRFAFEFQHFGWGGDWYRRHGEMMPADGLDALRGMDAILFGSAGDPKIPDHVTLWGLRLKICQGFDQYANVRPTRILPGIDAPLKRCRPQDLDWVIVRENSEGEYAGVGGRAHQGHPIEVATDVSVMTRAGVERIMRFAFQLARSRPRRHSTSRCRHRRSSRCRSRRRQCRRQPSPRSRPSPRRPHCPQRSTPHRWRQRLEQPLRQPLRPPKRRRSQLLHPRSKASRSRPPRPFQTPRWPRSRSIRST